MDINVPFISVVIPARNEEEHIEKTIFFLLGQDYPKKHMEILVIDGQSDDKTYALVQEITQKDSRVKLFKNPKRLSSSARNIGINQSKGDIVTFIDAHVYIDNNQLLKNTAILLQEKNVSVLSRPQLLDTPENNFFQQAVSLVRKSHLGHGLDSTIYLKEDKYVTPYSSGATYKKEVFEKVGLFNEDFDAAEDVEFNYRVGKAGYQSFSSMKLAVFYYPRKNFTSLFIQMKRYGIGRFRLFEKHKIGLSSGPVILLLFKFYIFFLIIGSIFNVIFRKLLLGTLVAYTIGGILNCLLVSLKKTIKVFYLLPALFITIHSGLSWGFFYEIVVSKLKKKKPNE